MKFQDVIQFARENPNCFLATVDGDQPHVRTVYMDEADETGFYFTLATTKHVYRQLCANPKVEICFFNHAADFGHVRQLRVTGKMEPVNNPALLEKAYEARKGLEQLVGKPIKPLMVLFRLNAGEAHFWTIMEAMQEEKLEILHFGV